MARRVFFSFDYDKDIWRGNVVRNSWVTQERDAAGFFDASLWEKTKKGGDSAIKWMIDGALKNTSVTAVLIGTETSNSKWVMYEIEQSQDRGNGLFGVYIHNIEDQNKHTSIKGRDPLSALYPTYDWVWDDGYTNFSSWVEKAAKAAGK